MTIARVEPLTTSRALRGPFDYLLPEGLAGAAVGSLLVVPFGRRKVLGVVVGLAERSELAPERLAAPLEALEQGVPADLVRLAGWMAEAYCSTPARALSLVLPPGAGRGQRARLGLVAELTPAGRAALDGSVRLTDGQRTAAGAGGRPGAPPPLSDPQRAALDRVRRAMAGEGGRELLLHGVTGSGKT